MQEICMRRSVIASDGRDASSRDRAKQSHNQRGDCFAAQSAARNDVLFFLVQPLDLTMQFIHIVGFGFADVTQ